MHLGDYDFGSTVFTKFTTVNSSGAPVALSSAGITVYRDGSTVPDTTGVALTASFNGVTGLNHVTISMSTTGIYSSAGTFVAVISSGAASETLTGYVVGQWTIRAKRPTDWARLYNSTTAVALSGTTISTAQQIAGVAAVNSTVQADVALWRGETPSTLFSSSWVRVQSQFSTAGLETASSNVNVAEWRGAAPSTLGTNSHIVPSSTAAILSVVSVSSAIVSSAVSISTASLISTAQTIASVATVTGNVDGSIGSLSTAAAIDVNDEMRDVLNTDLFSAPTGLPDSTATIVGKLGVIHGALIHGLTITASGKTFLDTSSAVQFVKGLSDDGTVYRETKVSTST